MWFRLVFTLRSDRKRKEKRNLFKLTPKMKLFVERCVPRQWFLLCHLQITDNTQPYKHTTFIPQGQALAWGWVFESSCLPPPREMWLDPWVGKIPWRRAWQPTPVFLPGESHGQRSLVGYSPWGHKELDMHEQVSTHLLTVNKASE